MSKTTRHDRSLPIPSAVHEILAGALAPLWEREEQAKLSNAIELQNTITMAHHISIQDNIGRVVLDWALIERALMFGHFFWGLKGDRLWRQKTRAFLEQEVYLAASRIALVAGNVAEAQNLHESYLSYEFAEVIDHRIDVSAQSRELTWYFQFAIYRQLAIRGHFSQIAMPQLPPSKDAAAQLSRDLNLDGYAFSEIDRLDASAVCTSLISELSIYIAVEELVRVVGIVAPRVGGHSLDFEVGVSTALDALNTARFRALSATAESLAGHAPQESISNRLRGDAELTIEILMSLKQALHYVMPRLIFADAIHMKSYGTDEGMEFLPDLERQAQIRARILSHPS